MKEADKNTLKYIAISAIALTSLMGLGVYLVEINKFVEAYCIFFGLILVGGILYVTGILNFIRKLF